MKILLLTPPLLKKEVYGRYNRFAPCLFPLGLGYLAAVLSKAGFPVRIIDCYAYSIGLNKLREEIIRYSPPIIGISSTTVAYSSAQEAFSMIKELNKDIITLLGGPHISALPRETMSDCKDIDIGVIGEAEGTMIDLVNALQNKRTLSTIDGICFRDGPQVIMNKPRQLIDNLDTIPFPLRPSLTAREFYYHTPLRGGRLAQTMITSRGCHHDCSYCSQSVFGRRWRAHSPEYVVSEMEYISRNYQTRYISIEDDNFLVSRDRALSICSQILTKNIYVEWGCSARLEHIDKNLSAKLSEAGCKTIYVGIESGTARIRAILNKQISNQEIQDKVRIIADAKMKAYGSFIIGVPSETKGEIEETIRFALALPLNGASFFIYTPFPRTKLRNIALQSGRVQNNFIDYSTHPTHPSFLSYGLNENFILRKQREAYLKFICNPKRLFTNRANLTAFLKPLYV